MKSLYLIFAVILCKGQILDCHQSQQKSDPTDAISTLPEQQRFRRSLTNEILDSSDLDTLDENGNTLLHRAVLDNSLDDLRLLLRLKANPTTPNKLGQTPLNLAASQTPVNSDITKLLRKLEQAAASEVRAAGQTNPHQCTPAGSKPTPPKCNDTMEETFQLIQDGENFIEVPQPEEVLGTREVILVIGNSGAGKSTVTQLLAGDNAKMNVVTLPNSQLIIVDDGGKIGETTTLSHTLFPERVVDQTNGAIFYDCPGFSDTRCSSMDIAAQYFIQKVVGNVDSVKILLTVDYVTLRKGGLRDGFTRVLDHTTKFLKNPSQFQDGLLMIVTKAPNYSPETGLTQTPELLQAGILDFLKEVKASLKPNEAGTPRKLSFLEALMETDEVTSAPKRIFVLQTPLHCGRIQENEVWQKSKVQIKTKLQEQLEYIPVIREDFSFSVSDSSKTRILQLFFETGVNIAQNLEAILSKIQEVHETELPILEKQSFDNVLNFLNDMMSNLNMLLNSGSTEALVDLLIQFQEDTGIPTQGEHLEKIKMFNKFSTFLTQVGEMEIPNQDEVWKRPIRDSIGQLQEERSWYSYLHNLFNKLSEYPTQTLISKLNKTEVMGNLTFEEDRRLADYKIDLLTLSSDYNNVMNYELTLKKSTQLEMVLKFSLSSITDALRTKDRLTVTGNYIKLSDLVPILEDSKDVSLIEVFSRHTLFIDDDLVTSGKNLVFLAPNWDIFGEKLMNLDGVPGPAPETSADGWDFYTLKGQDGLPGAPGGPGGSFLGFNLQSHGLGSLKFSLNGGEGGPGQGGGPGEDGKNGTDANFNYWSSVGTSRTLGIDPLREWILEQYNGAHISQTTSSDYSFIMAKDGGEGTKSGDGGNGGIGGHGGPPGNFYLSLPSGKSSKSVDRKAGLQGSPGPGGPPGQCTRKGFGWKAYVSVSDSEVWCFVSFRLIRCFAYRVHFPEWIEPPCIQEASARTPGASKFTTRISPMPPSPPSIFKASVLRYQKVLSETPPTLITGSLLKRMSEEMTLDPNMNLVFSVN